jgi:HK97 gp10 family phage protein
MNDELSLNVTGIDQVCANLDKLPDAIQKQVMAQALAAAAVPVAEALEAAAPVRTGKLKASLKTDLALAKSGKGGRVQIGFGKQGFVARMLEFGHRMIGHLPNKVESTTSPVKPEPFMRTAATESMPKALEAFAESVRENLDKIRLE